ncbi:MAG: nucleotidyltransferase domain-containing protein [Methylococcaceae bacterium]|nr:nucleotidyltransferase domain-containing protein [Methylococcaceae bacterium]
MNETPSLDVSLNKLYVFFSVHEEIELALLIGSRASGLIRKGSDWDFAIQWRKDIPWIKMLAQTETLRRELALFLQITPDEIDLVDLPTARLAMRAVVAEEGVVLKGDNTLSWSHFLLRTWGELEDFYWRQQHAA